MGLSMGRESCLLLAELLAVSSLFLFLQLAKLQQQQFAATPALAGCGLCSCIGGIREYQTIQFSGLMMHHGFHVLKVIKSAWV